MTGAITWHLAICGACSPPLTQEFLMEAERDTWAGLHAVQTGHPVRYATEIRPPQP